VLQQQDRVVVVLFHGAALFDPAPHGVVNGPGRVVQQLRHAFNIGLAAPLVDGHVAGKLRRIR